MVVLLTMTGEGGISLLLLNIIYLLLIVEVGLLVGPAIHLDYI